MKLATLKSTDPDGRLVLVSRDLARACDASDIVPNLRQAIEQWRRFEPLLRERFDALQSGRLEGFRFDPVHCAALPRAFQWCDGSAFLQHGRLMEQAFKHPPRENFETIPLLYQGGSDDFIGPCEDVPLPDESHGIDFEGEFVVITDGVPMGCDAMAALERVILLGQANDWSLRALVPREMNTGFGFFQGKPSTSFAPVVATPDELGPAWADGRVKLDLEIHWNGQWFGRPHGAEMHFHFGELIAHAARTRRLGPGTVVGSGTVSNARTDVGSACISERRVIEIIQQGKPVTGFMKFGDRVTMAARDAEGRSPFGVIDQRVVAAVAQGA